VNNIFSNQGRLRENLKSLEKLSDSALTKRYLKDLNEQEDELNASKRLKLQAAEDLERNAQEQRQLRLVLSAEATKAKEALELNL
jgi:hypothetical protein